MCTSDWSVPSRCLFLWESMIVLSQLLKSVKIVPGENVAGKRGRQAEPADGYAVRAIVTCVGVVFPLGIVELRRAPFDDHVAGGALSEIDARFGNRRTAGGCRRDIPQGKDRQAFGGRTGVLGHGTPAALSDQARL